MTAAGTVSTGYTGAVNLSSSIGAMLPPVPVIQNGQATFPVTFTTDGLATISCTDSSNPSITGVSNNIYVAPDVAQDEVYVDASPGWNATFAGVTTLSAGQLYYAHFAINNSSSGNWTTGGVALVPQDLIGGCSDWANGSSMYLPFNTTIATNHTAHFDFPIHAPTSAGTYPFHWRLNQTGTIYSPTAPPYAAAFSSFSVTSTSFLDGYVSLSDWPTQMVAGSTYDVVLDTVNTGTQTWTPGSGIMIGLVPGATTWGLSSTLAGQVFSAVQLPHDVLPANIPLTTGREITRIPIVAPSTPGTYNLQFQPMQVVNGVSSFFGTATKTVPITVVGSAGTDAAQLVSSVSPPATAHGGQSYNVCATFTNTGSVTWTAVHTYALWWNGSGAPWTGHTIQMPQSILPGHTVAFNFTVTAPPYNAGGSNSYTYQWIFGTICPMVSLAQTSATTITVIQ